ncbi:peptidylprolyl isomerase [Paenibacillus terrigena]|uniref:peptidylprolyl isomerase n=1 Tax=Paenibacillus terrigena TaxID=369333 RepID=UPI000362D727|nr:peptidylprolyl isomerase [Paenibacillus terrigena]
MKIFRRHRMNHKRLLLTIMILLTTGVTAAFARGCWSSTDRAGEAIATVNGVPISMAEYDRAIRTNTSRIIQYFRDTYQAEQSEGFWTKAYDGEIPAEMLKKKALEDSVKIKVRQLLAKEQGVLQDVSYQGFLQQLEQENERRTQAINRHQVVYGPAQYDENTYWEYVQTNAALAVKRNMQQSIMQQGESALRSFYDEHREKRYRTTGYVKMKRITRTFLDANQQIDSSLQRQVRKQLEAAAEQLKSGSTFEQVAAAYNMPGTALELTIQLGDERRNARSAVAQAAMQLPVNAISAMVEEKGSYHILKCIERVEPGSTYQSYEQVKDQVLQDTVTEAYEFTLRKMLTTAVVQVNEYIYPSFQIQ